VRIIVRCDVYATPLAGLARMRRKQSLAPHLTGASSAGERGAIDRAPFAFHRCRVRQLSRIKPSRNAGGDQPVEQGRPRATNEAATSHGVAAFI